MSFDTVKKLNPSLKLYRTSDAEFAEYGRIIKGIDTTEIVKTAQGIAMPETGSVYEASTTDFEALSIKNEIQDICYGELPAQIGYCYGHSNFLNGWEWHTSSEVNVAVTDLVLILGKVSDIKDGKIDSSTAKAFYVEQGEIIEVYATSLHFCPCEVAQSGFGCVVALPVGTNVPLEREAKDKLLFRKNKWIFAHVDNEGLIARGVVPGITGENYEVKY